MSYMSHMSPARRLDWLKAIRRQLVASFCQPVHWPVRLPQAITLHVYLTPQRTLADRELAYIERALQRAFRELTDTTDTTDTTDYRSCVNRFEADAHDVNELKAAAPWEESRIVEQVVLGGTLKREKTVTLLLPRVIALDLVYFLLTLQQVETEPFCASPFCLGTEERNVAELRAIGQYLETILLVGSEQIAQSDPHQDEAIIKAERGGVQFPLTTKELMEMTATELDVYLNDAWQAQQLVESDALQEARQRILDSEQGI